MTQRFQAPDSAAQIVAIPVLAIELLTSILRVPLLAVQLFLSIVTVPFVMAQMTTSVLGQAAGRVDGMVGTAASARDQQAAPTLGGSHSGRLADPYDTWRPPPPPDPLRRETNGPVRSGS